MYVLTLQGALFDTETGLVKLRRPAVYEYNTYNICLTKVMPKPALRRLCCEVCQIEAVQSIIYVH